MSMLVSYPNPVAIAPSNGRKILPKTNHVAERLERLELRGDAKNPLLIPLPLLKQIEKQNPSLRTIVLRNASDVFAVQYDHRQQGKSFSTSHTKDPAFQTKVALHYPPFNHPIRFPFLTTLIVSSSSSPLASMNIYQLILFGSFNSLTILHISLEIIAGSSPFAQPLSFEVGVKELWIDATASKEVGVVYQHPAKWLRPFALLQRLEIALCNVDAGTQEAYAETGVVVANIFLALCGISNPVPTKVLCRALEKLGCTWVRTPSSSSDLGSLASKRAGFPYPLSIELDAPSPSIPTSLSNPHVQVTPSCDARPWAIDGERKQNLLLYFLAFSWYRSLFPNGRLMRNKERREWGVCSVTLRGWRPPPPTSGPRETGSRTRALREGEDEELEVDGLLRDSRSHSEERTDEGGILDEGKDLINVTFAEMYEEMEDAGVDVEKVVDLCLGPA